MPPKLVRVTRLDSMPITKAQYTEEGYLIDKPILTSVGIFEYHNPDGTVRRELRLPEEVFAPESLASYRGKPIIITHDAGLIDKDNVSREQIGTIMSEGIQDGEDVRAEIEIHDTDKMKRSGFKELSLGYNLDLDETPGVYKGKHYDAIQRNIFINHLALVESARAGEQARLNIDGRDNTTQKVRNDRMAKTKKTTRGDGILSPEELKNAIAEYRKNHPKTDADEEVKKEEIVAPVETSPAAAPMTPPVANIEEEKKVVVTPDNDKDATIEDKVQEIRDEHKDDDDAQMLCDIIDTLLAKLEFNEAGAPDTAAVATDSDDDDEDKNCDADDDEDEDENKDSLDDIDKLKGDGDDDDEDKNCDADDDDEEDDIPDDDIPEDPDDENEDEDDDENEDEDDDEDDDTEGTPLPDVKKNAKMNEDSIDRIVRERIKVGMIGRAINLDGLENKDILSAKKAIIKRVRPGIRLDGKSEAYICAAYDCAVEDIKANKSSGVKAQRKQMFNKDTADKKRPTGTSADQARKRMINRMNKKSN